MAHAILLKAPGAADQLESVTIELPPPGPDEIRVRQTAIGVNFIDIYQRMGLYPLPPAAIPGVEAVGVVTKLGANVTSPRVGDRIAYAGAPLITPDGHVLGTLCAIDHKPRHWTTEQVEILCNLAGSVLSEIQLHAVQHHQG